MVAAGGAEESAAAVGEGGALPPPPPVAAPAVAQMTRSFFGRPLDFGAVAAFGSIFTETDEPAAVFAFLRAGIVAAFLFLDDFSHPSSFK